MDKYTCLKKTIDDKVFYIKRSPKLMCGKCKAGKKADTEAEAYEHLIAPGNNRIVPEYVTFVVAQCTHIIT